MLAITGEGQSDYFVWYFFLQLGGDGQSEILVNKNSLQVLVLVASEKPVLLYWPLLAYLVLVMAE